MIGSRHKFETVLQSEPRVGDGSQAKRPLRLHRIAWTASLLISDCAALALAFRLAYWTRFELQLTIAPEAVGDPEDYLGLALFLIPLWLLVLVLSRLYDHQSDRVGVTEVSKTFNACTIATMLVIVGTFAFPQFVVARMWLIALWVLSFLSVSLNRFIARRLLRALRRRGLLVSRGIIVGTNQEAASLAAFLSEWDGSGLSTVGFLSTRYSRESDPRGLPVLGSLDDVAQIVTKYQIDDVVVAITSLSRDELLRLCEQVDGFGVQLRLSSGVYELLTTRVTVHTVGTVPLMSVHKNRLDRWELVVKTGLECAIALLALIVLSPLLLLLAIAIKLDSPGAVIYRRRVLGVSGRQFDAFKFRTMRLDGDALLAQRPSAAAELRVNHKLKRDPRVTRLGRWLRKFSLDEIPQLANVLMGQMSLVGPRMITAAEAEKYGRQRINLLAVKPGITGLWQVSGRSDLSYEERVRMDMYYVRNYSVWMDLQILFIQTLPAVLKGRGAY